MGLFDGTELESPVICTRCEKDVKICECPPVSSHSNDDVEVEPSAQRLTLRLEKRKRGKTVTIVAGISGSSSQRQSVLTELKNLCGAGGTQVDGTLEIQGDHVARIRERLRAQGFRIADR